MRSVNLVRLLRVLAIGAVGALVGYAVAAALKTLQIVPLPSVADVVAFVIAIVCLFGASMALWVGRSDAAFRRRAEPDADPAEPVDPQALSSLRLQAGVLSLVAAMLLATLAATRLPSGLPRAMMLGGAAILFVGQAWLNLRLWQAGDELFRRVVLETAALSFWLLQGALFLWAVGERLGVLPRADAWSEIMVLLTVYLAACARVATRRGLGRN